MNAQDRLTDETVRAAAEEAYGEFDRIGRLYARGMLSGNDFFRQMETAFDEGFRKVLRDRGLILRIHSGNYASFAEGFRAYPDGRTEADRKEAPWLYRDFVIPGNEASEADGNRVFYLMARYHLPPAFFLPPPEDVAVPDRTFAHGWNNCAAYSVAFRCTDDGGLTRDGQPVGKTFRLTDDRGLNALVTIREDRRTGGREGLDFDEAVFPGPGGPIARKAAFSAEGMIEGFTAKERDGDSGLLIRTDGKGRICRLAYYEFPEDREAFQTFPLWQPYFQWSREQADRQKSILSAFWEGFR